MKNFIHPGRLKTLVPTKEQHKVRPAVRESQREHNQTRNYRYFVMADAIFKVIFTLSLNGSFGHDLAFPWQLYMAEFVVQTQILTSICGDQHVMHKDHGQNVPVGQTTWWHNNPSRGKKTKQTKKKRLQHCFCPEEKKMPPDKMLCKH